MVSGSVSVAACEMLAVLALADTRGFCSDRLAWCASLQRRLFRVNTGFVSLPGRVAA